MNPPQTVPPPPRRRPGFPWWHAAALLITSLAGGCVSVRSTSEEDLPAAWRAEVKGVSWRLPSGRFAAEGKLVRGESQPVTGGLEQMFFPGQFRRSRGPEVIELTVGADGACTARAWKAGQIIAELSLPGRIDPKTGWVELSGVPVKDTNKFGVVMGTQSIRFGLGADGALYVRAHSYGAGMVLLLPAAGSSVVWGRWEPAPR
ncbi:MAG: hypothetical protein FJ381_13145 [Verrucomicrobia bacterium]|nr:hypothetical protein [Verrucomicrobiota bacterium]